MDSRIKTKRIDDCIWLMDDNSDICCIDEKLD